MRTHEGSHGEKGLLQGLVMHYTAHYYCSFVRTHSSRVYQGYVCFRGLAPRWSFIWKTLVDDRPKPHVFGFCGFHEKSTDFQVWIHWNTLISMKATDFKAWIYGFLKLSHLCEEPNGKHISKEICGFHENLRISNEIHIYLSDINRETSNMLA